MSVSNFEYKSAREPIIQFMTGSKTYEGRIQSNGKPSIVSCLKWDGGFKTTGDQEHAQNAIASGVNCIIVQFIQQENAPKKTDNEYVPTVGIELSNVVITNDGDWVSIRSRGILVELVKNGDNWCFGNLLIPGCTQIDPREFMDFKIDGLKISIKFKWNQYAN